MKIPIFPGKYHQNGGFSWAMLVYRRVNQPQKKFSFSTLQGVFFFNRAEKCGCFVVKLNESASKPVVTTKARFVEEENGNDGALDAQQKP